MTLKIDVVSIIKIDFNVKCKLRNFSLHISGGSDVSQTGK